MANKQKTIYCCTECGNETANWAGKCPSCGSWNTLTEMKLEAGAKRRSGSGGRGFSMQKPKKISELDMSEEIRFTTGISEFDRVLGGGAVMGSLVLVGGAPGIGKSTLLLQMCGQAELGRKILYVTGEESERQLKLRANRLGIENGELYVLAETDIENILSCIDELAPEIVIIDSIQTVSDGDVSSAPGSITQVRECTMRIMRAAKDKSLTVFVVGHINKEGSIAGPKVLEHMVDCVLYFEGERNTSFRILRAAKNRFGSTNEIGVFEMAETGLNCVENPSEMLLSGRPENSPGTCVACVMEGTRPLLAEIQALVSPSSGYNASRRSNGIDNNRAAMLLAVLEKRGGMPVSGCDSYINVIGGLFLEEPAADLATVLAIASSFLDRPLGADLAAIGEVGLSGEIRSVSVLNQRLSETARLGFRRCVIPAHVKNEIRGFDGLQLIPVKNVGEAIAAVLGKEMKNFVELSSLPRVAESIIIGSKYAEILKKPLEKMGISLLPVPENPNVDPRISGHADLSVFHAGGKKLYLAQHLKDTDFAEKLSRLGAELEFPEFQQKREYPSDAYLNARAVGKKLIYGKNVTADFIVKYFTNHGDEVLIGSRQGYVGCSVCVVDENSIITADSGIAKAAMAQGLDVLLILQGYIDLTGFEYGFIGGASFKLSKDELAFTGVLDEHPDKKEIMSFLASKSVEPVFLTDRKIFDIGGGIPLIEK